MYNPNESKSSVRAKTWNYKPSSRYGSRSCSTWALKKIENYKTVHNNSVILCNFCAATLYRNGIFVASVANKSDESIEIKKSYPKKKHAEYAHHIDSSIVVESELNFLHLTGPSPRSLFIRKNFDFLVNNKQTRIKLCQMKSMSSNVKDLKVKPVLYEKGMGEVKPINKIFTVITNDRIKMKIKPLQLHESQVIMNFLKAILSGTNHKFVQNKHKYIACKK